MRIVIEATPEEIAALTDEMQGRRGVEPAFVPETSDGPCLGSHPITGTASSEDM